VAGAAGLGNVERIDVGARVVLGKDIVGDAMATGAGMVGRVGVDTAGDARGLIGMAGLAVDGRDFFGVRIVFDVGVAACTLQAAVNA